MDEFEIAIHILSRSFTTSTRADGSTYTHLTDDAPEWVKDAVREAHAEFLPEDTRYAMIAEVAAKLDDLVVEGLDIEDLNDSAYEGIDDLIPDYNWERLQWLASSILRPGYCDEAVWEVAENATIIDRIAAGMAMEYREIWFLLLAALEKQCEN